MEKWREGKILGLDVCHFGEDEKVSHCRSGCMSAREIAFFLQKARS